MIEEQQVLEGGKDKVSEVFELISDKGYFTDEKEFRDFVVDPIRRKEAYQLIEQDGYFADENEFNSYFSDLGKSASAPTGSGGGDMNLPSRQERLGAFEINPENPQDMEMLQMQQMQEQEGIAKEQQRLFKEQENLTKRQRTAYVVGKQLDVLPEKIQAKRLSEINLSADDKKFIAGIAQGGFDERYYDKNWKELFTKTFDVNPLDMGVDKQASKVILASGYGLSSSKEKLDKYVESYAKEREAMYPVGRFPDDLRTRGITQKPEYIKLEKAYKKAQADFEQNIQPIKKKISTARTFVELNQNINLGAGVKLSAGEVQKRVDERINQTVGGRGAQELYKAKISGDEKAIKEAEKVYFADIDKEISDINLAKENLQDPQAKGMLNEQIAVLNAQKQNFFKSPEQVEAQLSLVKPEYTSFQKAMNSLTPQERLKMYMYDRLNSFRKLAYKNGLSESQTNELLSTGSATLSTWFERATGQISGKEMNEMKDIMKEVHSIYPAAMLNVQPVSEQRTNVIDRAANSFKTTFGAMAMNDDEKAQNIVEGLGITETTKDILPKSQAAIDEQMQPLSNVERGFDLVGQTAAYVPQFMIGSGATNLLLRSVMSGAKYAKAPALYQSAKWMRGTTLPAKMANRGLSFAVTDEVFDTGEGALVGAAGAGAEALLGAAGKFGGRAMKTLFGNKADDFFKEIGKWNLSKKTGQGISELAEETAENITGLWQESNNGQDFRAKLSEQYGEIDNAMWNIISPFILGSAMGYGTDLGRTLTDGYKTGRDNLTPQQQAVTDKIVTDFTKEQNEAAQEMLLQVIGDVDTKDLLESKVEAEKTFDSMQQMYDAYVASGANGVLEMDIEGEKMTVHSLEEFNVVMDGHRDMLAAIEVELNNRQKQTTDETDEAQQGQDAGEESVLEGVRDDRKQDEAGQESAELRTQEQAEEEVAKLREELKELELKPLKLGMSDAEYKNLLDKQEERVEQIKSKIKALESAPPVVEQTTTDIGSEVAPDVSPAASVESTAKALEDKKSSLDEKAKKLGYIGIKQFNAQNQLNENLTDAEKELLQEYSDFQQEIKNLKDENVIAKLSDDEFSSWSKANDITRDDLGKVVKDEEIELAAKRIRILNARGDSKKAESELKKLKESKKKDNWTIESWKERFDEDIEQSEIDDINSSNKEFNKSVDKAVESLLSKEQTPPAKEQAETVDAKAKEPVKEEKSEAKEQGTPEAKPEKDESKYFKKKPNTRDVVIVDIDKIKDEKKKAYEFIKKYKGHENFEAKDIRNALAIAYNQMMRYESGAKNLLEQISELEDIIEGVSKNRTQTKEQFKKSAKESGDFTAKQLDIFNALVDSLNTDAMPEYDTFEGSLSFVGIDPNKTPNFYTLPYNILGSKDPDTFIHEIGHFAFYNILSKSDRLKYLQYMIDTSYGKEGKSLKDRIAMTSEQIDVEVDGKQKTFYTNVGDNFSEYFAEQFRQWYLKEKVTPQEFDSIFEKVADYLSRVIEKLKTGEYIDKNLIKYFDKIISTKAEPKKPAEEGKKEERANLANYFRDRANKIKNPDPNKPKQASFGIPDNIIAKAYEKLADLIEGGTAIAEAIGQVVKFVNDAMDKINPKWDAKGFEDSLTKEISTAEKNIAPPNKPSLKTQINKLTGVKSEPPKVATQKAVDKAYSIGVADTKAEFEQQMADLKSDFKEFMADLQQKHKDEIAQKTGNIKQQFKDFKEQQRIYGKRVVKMLENAKTKGFITDFQYRVILNRVTKAQTPNQWSKVFNLINRIIADSKQAETIYNIGKLQERAARRKHAGAKNVVNEFLRIAPEDIPPSLLNEYLTALTELDNQIPQYQSMAAIFYDIKQAFEKANPPKEIDYNKSFEKAEEYFDKIKKSQAKGITEVEEYKQLLRNAANFNRYIDEAFSDIQDKYAMGIITDSVYTDTLNIYNDIVEQVGRTVEEVSSFLAADIDTIKGELISDIQDQASQVDKSKLTKEEAKMMDDVLAYGATGMRKLTPSELDALSQILENYNTSGYFDSFRFKAIESRLYDERNSDKIVEQLNDARIFGKAFASVKNVLTSLKTTSGTFYEGALGIGTAVRSGAVSRFIFTPIRQALASVNADMSDARSFLSKLQRKHGIKTEEQFTKINMAAIILREHGLSLTEKGKLKDKGEDMTLGTRDPFRNHSRFYNNYPRKSEYNMIIDLHEKMLAKAIAAGKAKKVVNKGIETLELDPKDVYDSVFIRKDNTYLTKGEREYLMEIYDNIETVQRAKQEIANGIRGLPLDTVPFYLPRIRYSNNDARGSVGGIPFILDPITHTVKLKASAGYETVSEELGAQMTNINEVYLRHVEEVSRDYHVTNALKTVNQLMKSARQKINKQADSMTGDKAVQQRERTQYLSAIAIRIEQALNNEFGTQVQPDAVRSLVQNILTGTSMRIFVSLTRSGAEFTTAGSLYWLRMGLSPIRFYKNAFFKGRTKQMKLMNALDSMFKSTELITKDFVKDPSGRVKNKPINKTLIEMFASVAERAFVSAAWTSKFEQEYKRLTGDKFDINRFLTDDKYRSKSLLNAKEAAAEADNAYSAIAGETSSGFQLEAIKLPFVVGGINAIQTFLNTDKKSGFLVPLTPYRIYGSGLAKTKLGQKLANINPERTIQGKNTLAGTLFSFLAGYPYRSSVQFSESASVTFSLSKKQGIAIRAAGAGAMTALIMENIIYQMNKDLYREFWKYMWGDDDEKEKALESIDEVLSMERISDELLASGIGIVSSRYQGFGRTLVFAGLTIKANQAKTKEEKARIVELAKNITYSNVKEYDAANKFATEQSLKGDIAGLLVFINPLAEAVASGIESYKDINMLMKDIDKNGLDDEKKDFIRLAYGLYRLGNAIGIFAGYGVRSTPLELAGKKAELEASGFKLTIKNLQDMKIPASTEDGAIEIKAETILTDAGVNLPKDELVNLLTEVNLNTKIETEYIDNEGNFIDIKGSEIIGYIKERVSDDIKKDDPVIYQADKYLKKFRSLASAFEKDSLQYNEYIRNVTDIIKKSKDRNDIIEKLYIVGYINQDILYDLESKQIKPSYNYDNFYALEEFLARQIKKLNQTKKQ
jgi:hypothetical protein